MPRAGSFYHSIKTRKQMSLTWKRKYHDGYVCVMKGRHNPHSKSARKNMSVAKKGIIFSKEHLKNLRLCHLGEKHSDSHNRNNSLAQKGKHEYLRTLKSFNSKPEIAVGCILEEFKVPFEHQRYISDIEHSYCCDYYLLKTNTVLEVDGSYVHSLDKSIELDNFRNSELKSAGYNVVRIPAENFESVVDELFKMGEIKR